jgi:hypothetical protein
MDEDTFIARFDNWQVRLGKLSDADAYSSTQASSFDELCQLYLEASPKQRHQLPKMVAPENSTEGDYRRAFLVYEYMRRVSDRINSNEDVQPLRLGLAAAAIAEEGIDYRDVLTSLALLHQAATRAGIDPSPHFKQVADMARPETQARIRGLLSRSKREIAALTRDFSNAN